MFFGPFWVLHPVAKQAYRLELPASWKIHDIFHISILEQDSTRKGRVNKLLEPEPDFDVGKHKEYKLETIKNSIVYANEAVGGQLLGLYYLVSCKAYSEDENTWEPASAIIGF